MYFLQVDGKKSRIIAYSPGQQLQPHKHDLYESFEIRFGSVVLSTWDDGEEGEPVRRELSVGDKIEVRKCAKLLYYYDNLYICNNWRILLVIVKWT